MKFFLVMAGLVPAIHVLRFRRGKDVDARHYGIATLLLITLCASPAYADATFQALLQSLWPQAQALGISRATFDNATRGLEPDLTLPDLVLPGRPQKPPPGQPEFVQTPADYLKEPAIERLAAQGRNLYQQYRGPLDAIERQFGVPPAILLAIFGRETDYGRETDSRNAIRVLATQAYLRQAQGQVRRGISAGAENPR